MEATSGRSSTGPACCGDGGAEGKAPALRDTGDLRGGQLGRDVIETGYLAKQIITWCCGSSSRRLRAEAGGATDALLMAISNFGAAFERERASVRVGTRPSQRPGLGTRLGSAPRLRVVEVNGHKELQGERRPRARSVR